MRYKKLGRSDIEVSVVAMGCWQLIGDFTWGQQQEQTSIAAVHAALDVGINLFDTAEVYGDGGSEQVLGKALVGKRRQAIIASKFTETNAAPADVITACDRSLKRLGTDYIDLYQLHWPNTGVPLADTLGAMHRLKDSGKVRALGVCNFGTQNLADLAAAGELGDDVISNQVIYSLLARAIEFDVLPRCDRRGMGVLCYSPIAQGLLADKFASADHVPPSRARTRHFSKDRPHTRHGEPGCETETFAAIAELRAICKRLDKPMADVALAWCLHQPGVTSVLAGARSVQQVQQNAATAAIKLDDATLQALNAATEPVKQALGANADLWEVPAKARMR